MAYLHITNLFAQYDSTNNDFFCSDLVLDGNTDDIFFTFSCDNPDIIFTPTITSATQEIITVEFNGIGYTEGDYIINGQAVAGIIGNQTILPFTINLYVSNVYVPPPPPPVVTTPKFIVEYFNIENDFFELEIWDKKYTGTIKTKIRGNANHHYTDRKDLTHPIIASNLDITLEADENLKLADLYSENEGDFYVKFFRNSMMIFNGYLKPDGIWEDFVNDKWDLTLDAIDGLSMLKNLSFVKDNGGFFFGKISQYECVYYALSRIGYTLPINISTDLPVYTGFASSESILKSVMVNTERFYQEEGKVMDSESVLKSVLDVYNATIIQMHGEWWIYRTVDVKPTMSFLKYEGMAPGVPVTWSAERNLGSHKDDFELIHANANQRKSIDASLQAFRVNYKYGKAKSIIYNPELQMGAGLTADGWTMQSQGGKVVRAPKGNGVMITGALSGQEVIRSNQSIPVFIDDKIDLITQYLRSNLSLLPHKVSYKIETNTYILSTNGWVNKAANPNARVDFLFVRGDFWVSHTLNLPPILENGVINVTIYATVQPTFYISSINMVPSASNTQGEFHTGERKSRTSSVTIPDKIVYNGDSESNLFTGTLYKSDETPTTTWNRIGVTETKPLLQLLVEDTLRMRPRPMIFFEGDTYGYYPYLSLFTINNVPGKFQVGKYSYITSANVNKNNFKEFETAEMTDYNYRLELDYGNATRVGISVT